MSRDRAFTFALLQKLAAPLGVLALVAGTMSSAGCGSSTPTSSSTGTGGSGGAGGADVTTTTTTTSTGAGSCATAEDCPGTDTDCRKRSCAAGVCGFDNAPVGTATSQQTAGDCQASVCDGLGATTIQDDPSDVLDDQNDCTDDVCAMGAPENHPRASGAACTDGGKVCDGAGKCVECVDATGCADGVCSAHQCVPGSCLDGAKNNDETDVDCGGPTCGKCADGKVCAAGTDCVDTICNSNHCAKATCNDKAKNGAETDADCGGPLCKPCGPDLGCAVDTDCVGGSCSGSTCLPTCTDKAKNLNETDVDCGGPTCGACADAKTCAVGADCLSKVCTGGVCKASSCTDQVKNGTESDVDCGGSCGPCAPNQGCVENKDCATKLCSGTVCQGAVCSDGVKNGSETDVDCGGICATKCADGKGCSAGIDCVSVVCAGGACQAPACGDGVQNGPEDCDDGNLVNGDGCSSGCINEAGFTCFGTAPSVCTTTCGDGFQAGVELCDDANTDPGDGCSSVCSIEAGFTCAGAPSVCGTTCGDGVKAGAEACDDGNGIPGDGCSACAIEPGFTCSGTAPSLCKATCGDGIKAGAEQCDDGNTVGTDGCSATCTVQSGFTCTGAPSQCKTTCGDGVSAGIEQCDDNNLANGDCCSSACKVEAGCELEVNDSNASANSFAAIALSGKINGFIRPAGDKDYFSFVIPPGTTGSITATTVDNFLGITCTSLKIDSYLTLYSPTAAVITSNEDINASTNYCSTVTATNLAAGTYYVELKASLIVPTTTFAYTLQASISVCGNGKIEAPEACDGGPTCAADCTLLPVCGDFKATGAEQCDDGNAVSGDGCSATCLWEKTAEVEPNDTTVQADANPVIAGSAVIGGTFASATDKDIYKISVAAAGVARFEIFDSGGRDCVSMPTSTLTLLGSTGTTITQDTATSEFSIASGISTCAALVYNLAPGTYYLQAATGAVGTYLLQARFEQSLGSEVEPNETSAAATALAGRDVFISGAHPTVADSDYYAVTVLAGDSIRAEIVEGDTVETCESLGVDSYLTLFNAAAASLVTDDDDGRGYCSAIDGTGATPRDSAAHNLAAGTYYLQVKSSSLASATGAQFNYRLAVTLR